MQLRVRRARPQPGRGGTVAMSGTPTVLSQKQLFCYVSQIDPPLALDFRDSVAVRPCEVQATRKASGRSTLMGSFATLWAKAA